jgi:hypothetical protein
MNAAEKLIEALKAAKKSGFIKNVPQIFDYIFLHGFLDKTKSEGYKIDIYKYVFSDYSQITVSTNGFIEIFEPVSLARLFEE